MSAEKTVIALRMRGKSHKLECRFALVSDPENMTRNADYPSKDNPQVNREWVLSNFGAVQVFTSSDDAAKEETRIKEEMGGTCRVLHFDFSGIHFPSARHALSEVAELLKAGGWSIDGGVLVESLRIGLAVSNVTMKDGTLRFVCGSIPVEVEDECLVVRPKGQPACQIDIRRQSMGDEGRKQKRGGSRHATSEVALVRFVNAGAQATNKKQEEQKAKERARAEYELHLLRQDAHLRHKLLGIQTIAGMAKCLVLSHDDKEDVDMGLVNVALRLVFDGSHCPCTYEEDQMPWDRHTYVVSSLPLTMDQVVALCRKHFDDDDDD